MQDRDEELQAEVVQKNIAHSHHQVPDNLSSASQGGTAEADVSRHPEARQESDGELEYESCNVGSESNETQVEHLSVKDEMVEHIIQHPFQSQVHSSAGAITEQLKAHHLAEGWIEKIDDRSQGAFYPGFYVAEC